MAATDIGNETMINFKECLKRLVKHVFSAHALQSQKRYMRCFLHKKCETPICKFMARMIELNNYMVSFPDENEDSKLPVEELLNIAKFGVPAAWQKLMVM